MSNSAHCPVTVTSWCCAWYIAPCTRGTPTGATFTCPSTATTWFRAQRLLTEAVHTPSPKPKALATCIAWCLSQFTGGQPTRPTARIQRRQLHCCYFIALILVNQLTQWQIRLNIGAYAGPATVLTALCAKAVTRQIHTSIVRRTSPAFSCRHISC